MKKKNEVRLDRHDAEVVAGGCEPHSTGRRRKPPISLSSIIGLALALLMGLPLLACGGLEEDTVEANELVEPSGGTDLADGLDVVRSAVVAGCENLPVATRFSSPLASLTVTGYGYGDPVGGGRVHGGEDMAGVPGTPVYAIADGCVVLSREFSDGYGNVEVVEHLLSDGTRVISIYGHLSRRAGFKMRAVGPVRRGDILGYIGHQDENGGWSPHLHLGVKSGAYAGTYAGHVANLNGYRRPTVTMGNFNFNRTSIGWAQGRHGWSARNAVNRDAASASAWTLDPGADPGIVLNETLGPSNVTGLDPLVYNAVRVSLSSRAPDGNVQLYFRTVADPVWDEAKSIRGQVVTNGAFQQVTFDARNNAAWRNGRGIISVRLDPASNGAAGDVDRVAIDWLVFFAL